MQSFNLLASLGGGALIGLAAVLLLALAGRVAGVSGIAGRIAEAPPGDRAWRVAFLGGLVLGTALVAALGAGGPGRIEAGAPLLVAAGLLVGFGTLLGNGCTSGHGVCGLARLSPRSLAATVTFMAVAAATVFVVRHLLRG